MARLFITTREIDFIADLTKEITKDVIGQSIYYYRIREDISEVHEVYEESLEKIFDPPIEIETRVMWNPQDVKTDRFGLEATSQIEIYVHYRDMCDKGITLLEGDYFSFGADFFEITSIKYDKIIPDKQITDCLEDNPSKTEADYIASLGIQLDDGRYVVGKRLVEKKGNEVAFIV